jgi:hypothetical protein
MVLGNTQYTAAVVVAVSPLLLVLRPLAGSLWSAVMVERLVLLTVVQGRMEVPPLVGVVQGSARAVTAAQGVWL